MAQSPTIGSLRVVLGLDSAQFEKGLHHAKQTLATTDFSKAALASLKNLERGLEESAGQLGAFGLSLASMGGVGLAAAAGLGAVAEALHRTGEAIESAAGIAKLANTIGVSTDFIQKFNFAARQSEVDIGGADEALKGLNTSLGLVQSGLARSLTTKAFAAVGFSPEQLRQFHDVGDFFPVLVDRIAAIGNAAEQAAIAKRLGIADLLPLLRAGETNFNALARAAQDLGVVMGSDVIAHAEEAKKKLNELDAVMKAQKDSTFAEYAKTLIAIKEAFDGAQRAGLNFLAFITGTQSLDSRIAKLQGLQTEDALNAVRNGTNPSKDRELASVTSELNGLRLARSIQQTVGAGAELGSGGKPATALSTGTAAKSNLLASEAAIAAAQKAELQARIALTGDIANVAALRQQEVDQETEAANKRLQTEADEKKITQHAADIAIAANNQAALEKKALIVRQATFDSQNAELSQRQLIEGYSEQVAQIEESLAKTLAERQRLEAQSLEERQKLDRDKLVTETDQAVLGGKKSVLDGLAVLDGQQALQTAQKRELAEKQRVERVQQSAAHEQAGLQLQADVLSAQADLKKSTFARNVLEQHVLDIQQQIERSKAQEAVDVAREGTQDKADAEDRLAALTKIQSAQRAQLAAQTRLVDAISEANNAAQDLASAFKAHNWARVFDDFEQTIQTVEAAFASQGRAGGIITAGGAIGSAIGGRAGNAIASGFGLAGLGESAGTALFGATTSAAFAGTIGGGLANLGLGLSSLLGPIGIIAGIGVALAGLIGNKPSNDAAISTLTDTSFSISGNKRTADTTNLATSASNAILQGEKLLTDAGIKLSTTVRSIDIGVRDTTHVLLSNGQRIETAVGNAAAAAEAGLKAVLQGATFASDAEKQLVDSMLAAGKGFDDIATALQGFSAAQLISGTIAQAIQKLQDPQAFDVAQLKASQAARAAEAQAAADAGFLTADQLTAINAQLAKLDDLELDQVLQKYADAANQAAEQLLNDAKSHTAAAQADLSAARDAAAAPLEQAISQFQGLAQSLQAYRATLDQAGSPQTANLKALGAAFTSTAARAQLGDTASLGALQGVAEQYRTAALAQAHTSAEAAVINAKIKSAVSAGADTAVRQATIAQQSLDALNAQVGGLLGVKDAVLTIPDAIQKLQDALVAEGEATQALLARSQPPVIPAFNPSTDNALTSPSTAPIVDPASLTASLDPSAIADQVAEALKPQLNAVAMNTKAFADLADEWNAEGLLTRTA